MEYIKLYSTLEDADADIANTPLLIAALDSISDIHIISNSIGDKVLIHYNNGEFSVTEYEDTSVNDSSIGEDTSVNDSSIDDVSINTDFIDLGLPSGKLWCKYNIGAENELSNGTYYRWADIDGYDYTTLSLSLDLDTYKYYDSDNYCISKYNGTDGLILIENSDDIVYQTYGEGYCIPSADDFQELLDNTTLTDEYTGIRFDASNGNSIFIPYSGYSNISGIVETHKIIDVGVNAGLWTSTRYVLLLYDSYTYANCLYIKDGETSIYYWDRNEVMNIRAIKKC